MVFPSPFSVEYLSTIPSDYYVEDRVQVNVEGFRGHAQLHSFLKIETYTQTVPAVDGVFDSPLCYRPRGGGGIPRQIGWGVCSPFLKTLTLFSRPKSAILPTL